MGIAGGVVVFVILWWLVFFMTLPIGVRRDENPEEGHDPGAPRTANIGKKMLIATAITIVLFGALYAAVETGLLAIDFRR